MGGGDLNQKKSWHPNTIKNQERVWRAEQTNAAEQRRMDELKHEIAIERDREELQRICRQNVTDSSGTMTSADVGSKKLEWMYKGTQNLLNREEYLLGRQVDKTFEKQDAIEREKEHIGVIKPTNHVEHECIPFSIRQFRDVPANDEQVDLQRKMIEDPLMAVKQRELETRRKLLENPVKLAEIHRLLQKENPGKQTNNKSTKKSKSKKSHKSKRRRSSDSSSSSSYKGSLDLDSQLVQQLHSVDNEKTITDKLDVESLLQIKYRQINEELQKFSKSRKSSKKRSKSKKHKSTKRRSNSSSATDREQTPDYKRKPLKKANPFKKSNNSEHNEYESVSRRQYSCDTTSMKNKLENEDKKSSKYQAHHCVDSDTNNRISREQNTLNNSSADEGIKPYGLITASGEKIKLKREHVPTARDLPSKFENNRRKSPTRTSLAKVTRVSDQLTSAERSQRLAEMQSNANWREDERRRKVNEYKHQNEIEERVQSETFDKDFSNRAMQKAMTSQVSIEARLKANRNNIQRKDSAMSTNFVRR